MQLLKQIYLLIFCYFSVVINIQSQAIPQLRFIRINYQEQTSSNFSYNVAQTPDGLIYFALSNGLYSYDNKKFQQYKPQNQPKGRNINNILIGLYYDKKIDRLWCSSIDHVAIFNPNNKEFDNIDFNKGEWNQIADAGVTKFLRDKKDRMWMATNKLGLGIWNEKNQTFQSICSLNNGIMSLIEDENRNIWACTYDTLFFINSDNLVVEKISTSFSTPMSTIVLDKTKNCLWISTMGNGLLKFNLKSKQFSHFKYSTFLNGNFVNNGVFYAISKIDHKHLLISSSLLFDTENEIFKEHKSNIDDYNMPIDVKIQKIFTDQENNLWFATHQGMYLLCYQNKLITNEVIINPENQFGVDIGQIIKLNKALFMWIWGYNGLIKYDLETKEKKAIQLKNAKTIYSISKIDDNSILLTTSDGLFIYNYTSNSYQKFIIQQLGSFDNLVVNSYIDLDKNYWLSVSYDGLYKYTHSTNKLIKTIDYKIQNKNSTLNYLLSFGGESNDGFLWLFERFHIYKINKKTNEFILHDIEKQKSTSEIRYLICDKKNQVWLTDIQNGLSQFITKNQGFTINPLFKINSELETYRFANGLAFDYQNNLWFASGSGIICFDTKNLKIIAKKQKVNGLFLNGNDRKILFLDSILLIENWSSFDWMNLNDYKWNNYPSKLLFSNFTLGSQKLKYYNKNEIILPFNQSFFSFDIGYTGYNNSFQNKIYYQLIGADVEPKLLDKNSSISYSGLNAGNYQLKIWLENNNAIKTDEKTFFIKINPPFYKTWWFILLILLLVSGLIYLYYKLKIKQKRIENDFKQKLTETEMQALRSQMNPHFMFNALNSIQKFILTNETKLASNYLTKFSRMIRMILEQSKEKYITIEQEIEFLKLYTDLEKMRFNKPFEFKIEVDSESSLQKLIPSMLIQPFVENAIWHGLLHKEGDGKLSVSIKNKEITTVAIEDNGIGREKAKELKSKTVLKNKSYGMSITEERIKILTNQKGTLKIIDLKDEENHPIGTKIIIEF